MKSTANGNTTNPSIYVCKYVTTLKNSFDRNAEYNKIRQEVLAQHEKTGIPCDEIVTLLKVSRKSYDHITTKMENIKEQILEGIGFKLIRMWMEKYINECIPNCFSSLCHQHAELFDEVIRDIRDIRETEKLHVTIAKRLETERLKGEEEYRLKEERRLKEEQVLVPRETENYPTYYVRGRLPYTMFNFSNRKLYVNYERFVEAVGKINCNFLSVPNYGYQYVTT